jgi:hypothetical protein
MEDSQQFKSSLNFHLKQIKGETMALIQCPECKSDISDKTKSCPKCGHPINTVSVKKVGKVVGAIIGGLLIAVGALVVVAIGDKYFHKSPTIAAKPALPVEVGFRKALLANGLVAIFRNISFRELSILATFTNPTMKETKTFRLDLAPNSPKQFGHLEGWNFESGDIITLRHNDYQTWTGTFP